MLLANKGVILEALMKTQGMHSLSVQNTRIKRYPKDGNGHNIEKNFIKKVVVVWTGFRWLRTCFNGTKGRRTSRQMMPR